MGEALLRVEGVSKKFSRRLRQTMTYAALDSTRELLGLPVKRDTLRDGEFWAVRDISLEVNPGEGLAVLGPNGAGKSTLLKMLAGIFRPDRGLIRLRGRVSGLIEVGAGFHPLLSGRENIYVNGTVLGMNRREIDRKLDAIIDFAGLPPDAIEAPVKTYSSGMYVRLGFAVAAHSEPDLLLIDEALSVGDLSFVGKCRRRIADLIASGAGVVYVTHRFSEAEWICRRGVLLDRGEAVDAGPTRRVIASYRELVAAPEFSERPRKVGKSRGEPIYLWDASLLDDSGAECDTFAAGDWCRVRMEVRDGASADGCELLLWLFSTETESVVAAAAVPWSTVREHLTPEGFFCGLRLMAAPGEYQLGILLQGRERFDYLDKAPSCLLRLKAPEAGFSFIPSRSITQALLEVRLDAAQR